MNQPRSSQPIPPDRSPPTTQPTPPTARPAQSPPPATDAELKRLVTALGDPADPQYAEAADRLITFGPQAVPALIAALDERAPWLQAYRATEALGQIGDGRAVRPLLGLLRHPNSNVRWIAVQVLANIGDTRAILPLRRIARQDRGKTSWGESVSAAAQVALNDMSGRSAALRLADPAKTALLVAIAFATIWWATDRVQAFRQVLAFPPNTAAWGTEVVPIIPTAAPQTATPEDFSDLTPQPTGESADQPTTTPVINVVTAQARVAANIRPAPNTDNAPLAQTQPGQTLEIIEQAGEWYRIRLPGSPNETAWIAVSVVGPPSGPVPTAAPSSP